MMKEILLAALLFVLAHNASGQSVTAAQVNGTWATPANEFKILALGHQRLRIEFFGSVEYKSHGGPMANTGEGQGIAMIEGNTAIFKPDDAEDDCRITLRFTNGKLIVKETGDCGFGNRVTAEGTYKKISTRKPAFNSGND